MADKNKSSIHRILAWCRTQKPSSINLRPFPLAISGHESWFSYLDSNSGLSSAGSYLTSYASVCLCVCVILKKIVYTGEIENREILSPTVTFSFVPVAGRIIVEPINRAPNQERFSWKNNLRSLYFKKPF